MISIDNSWRIIGGRGAEDDLGATPLLSSLSGQIQQVSLAIDRHIAIPERGDWEGLVD